MPRSNRSFPSSTGRWHASSSRFATTGGRSSPTNASTEACAAASDPFRWIWISIGTFRSELTVEENITTPKASGRTMVRPPAFMASYTDDESWRWELCPDCGMRLFGLANWRDHAPRHHWGSEWLAARVRAAVPGGNGRGDPAGPGGPALIEIEAP